MWDDILHRLIYVTAKIIKHTLFVMIWPKFWHSKLIWHRLITLSGVMPIKYSMPTNWHTSSKEPTSRVPLVSIGFAPIQISLPFLIVTHFLLTKDILDHLRAPILTFKPTSTTPHGLGFWQLNTFLLKKI